MTKEKIAILGGGLASLSTAYELTSARDDVDVTVYQMGWRLGGKGASGVRFGSSTRVEEHGLHVWFGFYQNAFNLMHRVYADLGRAPHEALATVREAFRPVSTHTFFEGTSGDGAPWTLSFPEDDDFPGTPRDPARPEETWPLPGTWALLRRAAAWIRSQIEEDPALASLVIPLDAAGAALGAARRLLRLERRMTVFSMTHAIERGLGHVAERWLDTRPELHAALLSAVASVHARLAESHRDAKATAVRRRFILLDLALAGMRGMIAERVPARGFASLDDVELRDFLRAHGAAEASLASAVLRTIYDIFFAYPSGDFSRPEVAAGCALRGLMRTLFGYRGAILYKMNAGMGDAIVAPIYQVLRRRGVRFRFFHRVERLELDRARGGLARVHARRQAIVRGEYEPLVTVGGLPCWPAEPRWEQLEGGDAARRDGVDFECPWRDGPGVDDVVLERGRDFDTAVLGIPIAALPPICGELVEASSRWREMFERVPTVATQAIQLWFRDPIATHGGPPSGMMASWVQPFSSWSDFTQVLAHERWPASSAPRYLAYSCGVLPDPATPPAPGDRAYPARRREEVRRTAERWLEAHSSALWPATTRSGFPWDRLADPEDRTGRARLDAQLVRANVTPSDRYVLATPGSTRYRLRPDASGFAGLVLCGDWTDNGFQLGCIEATVMSGRLASRALCGHPKTITGEPDRGGRLD